MPTGTQAAPDEFTKAITTVVRLKMGWLEQSKADVERLTGIPHGTFSRIINDKKIPDIVQLRRIAAAVQVPLPALLDYAEGVARGAEPPFDKLYRRRDLRWECPVNGCDYATTMHVSGGDMFEPEDHAEKIEQLRLQHPNHPPSAIESSMRDNSSADDRASDRAMKDELYDVDSSQYWGGAD